MALDLACPSCASVFDNLEQLVIHKALMNRRFPAPSEPTTWMCYPEHHPVHSVDYSFTGACGCPVCQARRGEKCD